MVLALINGDVLIEWFYGSFNSAILAIIIIASCCTKLASR